MMDSHSEWLFINSRGDGFQAVAPTLVQTEPEVIDVADAETGYGGTDNVYQSRSHERVVEEVFAYDRRS